MMLGARHIAEHLYHGRNPGCAGYVNRARVTQDLSVVAGTCIIVRRDLFAELDGLDEAFPVCYNDVDFCLRVRQRGWRVVFTPDAVVCHLESASFGTHAAGRESDHRRDVELMLERWGSALADDPMHNPNLALDPFDPSRLAVPPRVSYPWRGSVASDGPSPSR
jgi:hypothetical protein